MRKFAALAGLLLASPAFAVAPDEAGLPTRAEVVAALDAHPSVAAANARTDAARAEADALARGPQEFTLSTTYSRRRVEDGTGFGNGTFNEYEGQLSRPFRLPGKAALDRQIGAQGLSYASNMAEDARHHTALVLAQDWWDWLGAAQEASVDAQAVANMESLLASVKRRVAQRDAAELEQNQTEAALGSARAQAQRSMGREKVARARLMAQFPALPLPAIAPEVPLPHPPAGGLAPLRDAILRRSHELAAAEALAAQADAQAARARAERRADPTLGLRAFSDRGGMERGAGVMVSIPFGGGYRAAQASKAAAEASAAQGELQATRLTIAETANTDLAEAEASLTVWQQSRAAVEAQVAALQKLRRGQQLGEISLSEVLLAERMVQDAFRAEAVARTDAMRAITRLRIDSHQLWIDDDEG